MKQFVYVLAAAYEDVRLFGFPHDRLSLEILGAIKDIGKYEIIAVMENIHFKSSKTYHFIDTLSLFEEYFGYKGYPLDESDLDEDEKAYLLLKTVFVDN